MRFWHTDRAGPDGGGRLASSERVSLNVTPSGACLRDLIALGSVSAVALSSTRQPYGTPRTRYVSREAGTSTQRLRVLSVWLSLCHEQQRSLAPPGASQRYPRAGRAGPGPRAGLPVGGLGRVRACDRPADSGRSAGGLRPPPGVRLSRVRAGPCAGECFHRPGPRHGCEGPTCRPGAGCPPGRGTMPRPGAGSEAPGGRRLAARPAAANRQGRLPPKEARPLSGTPGFFGRPGLSPVKHWGGLSPTTLTRSAACSPAADRSTKPARIITAVDQMTGALRKCWAG